MNIIGAFNPVLRDIKHYFHFLFERGFKVEDSEVGFLWPLNWTVMLKSNECAIKIWSHRDTIYLAFGSLTAPFDNRMGLEPMIYFLSQGQIFAGRFEGNPHDRRGQLARLSLLLKEHIDQILPCFQPPLFSRNYAEMLRAQKQYFEIFMKKYVPGWKGAE